MASSDWVAESTRASHTQDKAKRTKKLFKRIVGVAAVLVLSIGLVVSVSAEVRKRLYNAILEDNGNHYVVVYGPEDKEAPVYKEFIVTYVPEGYELSARECNILGEGAATLYEEYLCGDDALTIEVFPREYGGLIIDSEHLSKEIIEFDLIEGYFFKTEDGADLLLWSDGRYDYLINGILGADEYIKVSRGIRGVRE